MASASHSYPNLEKYPRQRAYSKRDQVQNPSQLQATTPTTQKISPQQGGPPHTSMCSAINCSQVKLHQQSEEEDNALQTVLAGIKEKRDLTNKEKSVLKYFFRTLETYPAQMKTPSKIASAMKKTIQNPDFKKLDIVKIFQENSGLLLVYFEELPSKYTCSSVKMSTIHLPNPGSHAEFTLTKSRQTREEFEKQTQKALLLVEEQLKVQELVESKTEKKRIEAEEEKEVIELKLKLYEQIQRFRAEELRIHEYSRLPVLSKWLFDKLIIELSKECTYPFTIRLNKGCVDIQRRHSKETNFELMAKQLEGMPPCFKAYFPDTEDVDSHTEKTINFLKMKAKNKTPKGQSRTDSPLFLKSASYQPVPTPTKTETPLPHKKPLSEISTPTPPPTHAESADQLPFKKPPSQKPPPNPKPPHIGKLVKKSPSKTSPPNQNPTNFTDPVTRKKA